MGWNRMGRGEALLFLRVMASVLLDSLASKHSILIWIRKIANLEALLRRESHFPPGPGL